METQILEDARSPRNKKHFPFRLLPPWAARTMSHNYVGQGRSEPRERYEQVEISPRHFPLFAFQSESQVRAAGRSLRGSKTMKNLSPGGNK